MDPTVHFWGKRLSDSEELKQTKMAVWSAYWRWYRNNVTPLKDPSQWWRSNESIPTVFKIVETILPRYLLGMFDNPDWFEVEARQERDEDYENLCQQLLRTKMEQMKIFPKVYDAIKYCTIMGHVWGKVLWEEKWMTRKVMMPVVVPDSDTGEPLPGIEEQVKKEQSYNGPQFTWLPLDRVWPDPSGQERYYIEQIDTTLDEILQTQEDLNIYDPEQLALLADSLAGGAAQGNNYDELIQARQGSSFGNNISGEKLIATLDGVPWSTVAPQRDGVGVELKQCWGWVPPHLRGKDKADWRLTVIANGQYKLRDVPAPTPDGKPPYFAIRSVRLPGILYGESVLNYVGPMADQQTRLANMRLDEVFLGIWQSMLIKQGALASDNSLYFKPGGYLELKTDPGTKLSEVVSILPRTPLLPQVWQEDMYRQTQAEHAAGASENMQGVNSQASQTATEVERNLQQGNARHVLQSMLFGYDFQKELLERTWEWLRMRMTTTEKIKLGSEYRKLDLRNIQVPIDITIGGGFFAMSRTNRISRSSQLAQMLQNPFFAQVGKPLPIFQQVLTDIGWKNIAKFMKTEEEFANEQAQQQTREILGLADPSQGMGGQGSPTTMPNVPDAGGSAGMAGQPLSDMGMGANPNA